MAHTVHKFSSEILKSASDIRKLVSIIPKTNSICVVSGLGETNTLFRELVKSAGQGNQEKALFIFEQIKQAHLAIANELNIPPRHLESCFIELNNRLRIIISSSERVYNEDYDAIVSYASILATTIIARYANLPIIDALKVIKTDGQFNNAKIDVDLSLKLFSEQLVNQSCFVAGNIGSDQKNRPTTFNVHGSNYTAATLAAFVKANEIVI
jgi:aspartokinase